MNVSLKGKLIKLNGDWLVELPLLKFRSTSKSLVDGVNQIRSFLESLSQDPEAKYTIKFSDGGLILVTSSNFHDFVELISHQIIQNPNKEEELRELLRGITIELEI
jgi:hypothetical protein